MIQARDEDAGTRVVPVKFQIYFDGRGNRVS